MIHTSMQLKAKIRNMSGGDSTKSSILLRNFVMERFLERVALSPYRNNFVLKGGMLVAAVVGLDTRATMDIDTTIKSLTLTSENAEKVINDIIAIEVPDGMEFKISRFSDIMEGHDYPGIRFMLETKLDNMRQIIKIDISTGDIITPKAVEYSYKLMFEDRSISIWTYNLETLIGEKLETIMARGITNTRMRDFYDIHVLLHEKELDYSVLKDAFMATSRKRGSEHLLPDFDEILDSVHLDSNMKDMWEKFRSDNFFVGDISWDDVNQSVLKLKNNVF